MMSGFVQMYSTVGVRVPICRLRILLKICTASFLPSKSEKKYIIKYQTPCQAQGPSISYVSKGRGGWVQKMSVFVDLQYYTYPLFISTGFFKYPLELKKKFSQFILNFFFSQFITEFLSQFEMNAEMDISKNQWRSTGGMSFYRSKRFWNGPN